MGKQIIIAVSREFGSGGLDIAEKISNKLGITLYDKNILKKMEEEGQINAEIMSKFDEKPSNPFFTRHMRGLSNSMEENLAFMQFFFIREKAEAGESFVVVGRCAEEVLKDNDNAVSVFVFGSKEKRIERIMQREGVDEKKASAEMKRIDSERKHYHNGYCDYDWGDSRAYDICISSDRLSADTIADGIIELAKKIIK